MPGGDGVGEVLTKARTDSLSSLVVLAEKGELC